MSYCINPRCSKPDDPANINNQVCRNCGSDLLLLGRYQVMRLLSDSSGFGKVYEAYSGATPKLLKVLKENHNDNSRVVELFQQEATVLGQLNHPGIPKVEPDGYFQFFPRGSKQPVHCMIMEKIDGLNLKQWMKQQGERPISQAQALDWLKQLAEILHLVHQKNYFHRDIKPANIMIRSTGHLVLIDFGTAREMTYTYLAEVGGKTGRVTRISSAGYTPPEQEKGHAVPQSDFFALGRTMVYLLTGKQATDSDIYDPLTDQSYWRQYAPDISPLLADFVDKLMARTAAARHKNTQEILDQLTAISQKLSQPQSSSRWSQTAEIPFVPVPSSLPPTRINNSQRTKNKWLVGGAVALVVGFGGYGTWQVYRHYSPAIVASNSISLGKTLEGHSSYVNYLVISPDGENLISASADKTIKLWNLATGKEIRTLKGHLSSVNYLAISSDGQTLISASADKMIKVWDTTTGKLLRTLGGHTSFVNFLVITPDGNILASASADKTIKLWNLATGAEIRTLEGHTSSVNALAISPDGQTLMSASADQTIKLWNLETGAEIRTLEGHTSFVNSLVVTPDGKTLVSASADKTIKLWNLATGEEIRTLEGHTGFVNYLALSPDGQKLMSGGADQTIKVWDMSKGEEITTLTGYGSHINYFVLSADWRSLASGSGDKVIRVWQVPKNLPQNKSVLLLDSLS
jgi:serine/threonine protein kinase